MHAMESSLEQILRFSPLLALASFLLIPLAWRRRGRLLPLPMGIVLGLWVVVTLALLVLTHSKYGTATAAVLNHADREDWGDSPWEAWCKTYAYGLLSFGAALFVAAVPLTVVAAVRAARSEKLGANRGPGALAIVFVGLAAMVVAIAVAYTTLAFSLMRLDCTALYLPSCHYANTVRAFSAADSGHTALLVLATLTTALIMAWPSAGPASCPRVGFGLATIMICGGALSWVEVRPWAYDARHPLEPVEVPRTGCSAPGPLARPCEMPDVPTLTVEHGAVKTEGVSELEPVRWFEIKRMLWQATNAGRKFPGVFGLVIEPGTSMTVVGPLLEAAKSAGYQTADIDLNQPQITTETRTLGPVLRSPCRCIREMELGSAAPPTTGTWESWIAASPGPRTATVP